jgi:hypothetical protein
MMPATPAGTPDGGVPLLYPAYAPHWVVTTRPAGLFFVWRIYD